jgi:23S rRNA pseudouridine1911/1915/1917 synthase
MLEILYEDNHLIIVNKPAGVLAQGDITGDKTIGDEVKAYIKKKYNKPGEVFLGVVHRIDRPVSGILILARTSKALERMTALFKSKEIKKTYWAVVKNKPPKNQDILKHYLIKDRSNNKSKAYKEYKEGTKECILEYDLICSSDQYHLLEVKPHTGRHHQIRVQLSTIGCPIKGDLKYGAERSNKGAFIHLHARGIDFLHPVKNEPISITAPVPDDVIWNYFEGQNNRKN